MADFHFMCYSADIPPRTHNAHAYEDWDIPADRPRIDSTSWFIDEIVEALAAEPTFSIAELVEIDQFKSLRSIAPSLHHRCSGSQARGITLAVLTHLKGNLKPVFPDFTLTEAAKWSGTHHSQLSKPYRQALTSDALGLYLLCRIAASSPQCVPRLFEEIFFSIDNRFNGHISQHLHFAANDLQHRLPALFDCVCEAVQPGMKVVLNQTRSTHTDLILGKRTCLDARRYLNIYNAGLLEKSFSAKQTDVWSFVQGLAPSLLRNTAMPKSSEEVMGHCMGARHGEVQDLELAIAIWHDRPAEIILDRSHPLRGPLAAYLAMFAANTLTKANIISLCTDPTKLLRNLTPQHQEWCVSKMRAHGTWHGYGAAYKHIAAYLKWGLVPVATEDHGLPFTASKRTLANAIKCGDFVAALDNKTCRAIRVIQDCLRRLV